MLCWSFPRVIHTHNLPYKALPLDRVVLNDAKGPLKSPFELLGFWKFKGEYVAPAARFKALLKVENGAGQTAFIKRLIYQLQDSLHTTATIGSAEDIYVRVLGEFHSFISKKANTQWLLLAMDKKRSTILDVHVGSRDEQSGQA